MDLLIYLAKASLLLTLFWLVYKLVLEAETYHRFKRIYLHAGYGLSLILPLLSYTKIEVITLSPAFLAPSSSEFVTAEIKPTTSELIWSFITEHAVLELIYIGISLVFLVHLLVKFFRLLSFLKASKAFQTDGIFHIQKSIAEGAFSFLNYIVYNPELYSEDELKIILAHEKTHVAHKHSLDMLFAHLYKCVFWFNPFAWLYQKSLVLNLEYEADAKVVDNTTKKEYQMTLYSITQQQFRSQLQHSFHQSPIKKRIAMLNKNKHNQSFWKLFIVSPLLVVFFLLFQVETKAQIKNSITTTESKVNRIEITYDENTTTEELDSDIDFLKKEFDIDMRYSNASFGASGQLKSLALDVDCNDSFKGSVASPDVAELPVYFYRDYTEDAETPFGVGIRTESEIPAKTDYNTIKDAENFVINGQNTDKDKLVEKYIPVEKYSYDKSSKTLSITTKSEFSEIYYSGMSELFEELKQKYNDKVLKAFTFFKLTSDYKVVTLSMDKFKISDTSINASQHDNSSQIFSSELDDDIIYLVDGKEIDKDQLNDIKPDQIESVDVKKSVPLIKANGYDPDQVKGIIQITTKKGNIKNASQDENSNQIYKGTLDPNDDTVIYLVDGKEVSQDQLKDIKPEHIKSVDVSKSEALIKSKGHNPDQVNGIVEIITKNGSKTKKKE
ncbi:M48 family metalloprotease [Psychroflexus sp. CAK57W]|uniref:M56 family metallopeptidase n=1 Tax=Psychroflexus curvus TaxID=2873595 RepID=UPI001CC8F5B7|nr:M56 family metallopeptidase [Psychroflexus curvus]MBZ9786879.1 M48 family metalloprotease [Psychroflexus curvus]